MRIKLDENIPRRLIEPLTVLGHDVDTVEEQRLTGSADAVVWAAAQREARFLITQDLDFSDVRRYQPGTHHGLLLIRLQAPGRNALLQRIRGLFSDEDTSGWHGCFVVATDRKLRVRRPG
jgi:predicted nuclease of predicted toxin-antitoxin system